MLLILEYSQLQKAIYDYYINQVSKHMSIWIIHASVYSLLYLFQIKYQNSGIFSIQCVPNETSLGRDFTYQMTSLLVMLSLFKISGSKRLSILVISFKHWSKTGISFSLIKTKPAHMVVDGCCMPHSFFVYLFIALKIPLVLIFVLFHIWSDMGLLLHGTDSTDCWKPCGDI